MPDEQERLKDLLSYQILDTEQEYAFDDLVDFVVARICDQLNISNKLISRWGH